LLFLLGIQINHNNHNKYQIKVSKITHKVSFNLSLPHNLILVHNIKNNNIIIFKTKLVILKILHINKIKMFIVNIILYNITKAINIIILVKIINTINLIKVVNKANVVTLTIKIISFIKVKVAFQGKFFIHNIIL